MTPSIPIIPGADLAVTKFAENQDEYITLPVWRDDDGTVLSRWHLTWWERLQVFWRGDVYLWQMTFNQPLQPIMLQVESPGVKSQGDQ